MNASDLSTDAKFLKRIQSSLQTVQNWENVELLQQCRSEIPWDDLRNPTGPYSEAHHDRLLAQGNALFLQRLCRWFQKTMTWVNAPPCAQCGCKETEMKTVRDPETDEEKEGAAKRVEVYYCPACEDNTTTFPRYNNPQKLLETRKGRCGEYANLFGLVCRSVGFETRFVLDLSDHVWTEIRLGDDWIMADSCEGVIDKPSMYEHGWGKKTLCFMIAIAKDHVIDVTPRYTRNFYGDDFQTRRRNHTTSEGASVNVLQQLNRDLQRNLTKPALDELSRRQKLEDAELQLNKQSREWTAAETYGQGRVSGSLAWRLSRQEAGKKTNDSKVEKQDAQVGSFEVEAFGPPLPGKSSSGAKVSLQVRPNPTSHHDAIIVSNTPCAIGEKDSVSVVVVDEACLGSILLSRSFVSWTSVKEFVNLLPAHRIVLVQGKCKDPTNETTDGFSRLGGWTASCEDLNRGVVYIGQVDAHPDWAFCQLLDACQPEGHEVELQLQINANTKLRTEKFTVPKRVACRLPESVMPLKTQVLATDEQKRLAFSKFCEYPEWRSRYCGYVTKSDSPVYLIDGTSYPFSKLNGSTLDVISKEKAWSTFHWLPTPLVPQNDNGIVSSPSTSAPTFEVPLETSFFINSVGSQLLHKNGTVIPTGDALHNSRMIGLYFSASWCGPCRQFTPMLAELYEHLKEHRPTHGLEIVFVSSDRDPQSFQQYYSKMPWQAIPFDQLQKVKQRLSMTYGVRGIPSFVVLDAVSGQVVVPPDESRQAIANACRGGEPQIEAMLDSWLERTPQETREILSMLELSCQEEEIEAEDNSSNPYLLRQSAPSGSAQGDTAARIKEAFEQLVAQGKAPTAAAAQAIEMVASEPKTKTLDLGPLNGKAIRSGPPAAVDPLHHALEQAVEWNDATAVANALAVVTKYLNNARKEPWSPKFRTFKLSNKVADQITRVEGGLALVRALGLDVFGTSQDFKATIPVATDLQRMQESIAEHLERLDK